MDELLITIILLIGGGTIILVLNLTLQSFGLVYYTIYKTPSHRAIKVFSKTEGIDEVWIRFSKHHTRKYIHLVTLLTAFIDLLYFLSLLANLMLAVQGKWYSISMIIIFLMSLSLYGKYKIFQKIKRLNELDKRQS